MLLIAAMAALAATNQETTALELRYKLDALEAKHFRGLVYVERNKKEVFYHTVGYADPDSKRPFTKSTGIEIGSIVKPIVGAAIYLLVEKGKLSLADPISKYFTDVPADKQLITIDKLIHHTAGFQDVFGDDYEPMQRDELMAKMLASKLLFTPGSKDEYSNSGYSMLATIIEKVTGEGLEQHIARNQFKRLGMKRTGYVLPRWKPDQVAIGTDKEGKRWGSPLDHFWHADGPSWNLRGNGGMMTTVGELARWCWAVHNGQLLNSASYMEFTPSFAKKEAPPTAMWGSFGGKEFGIVACFTTRRIDSRSSSSRWMADLRSRQSSENSDLCSSSSEALGNLGPKRNANSRHQSRFT
jgi:CubicO group peptidase (beta-lactamase class C family)